jgi:hypothetical protein
MQAWSYRNNFAVLVVLNQFVSGELGQMVLNQAIIG